MRCNFGLSWLSQNLFSKFEGNDPTICCMLCFSVRLQSLLGVFYMSRLCVDFTTIGRRGVFLQFKKLDSGQEGNKRLPGFSKTTWIFVIKLIIKLLYENCHAISVKCYGKNRAQWSSLCLSSYWNKKIEKEHEKFFNIYHIERQKTKSIIIVILFISFFFPFFFFLQFSISDLCMMSDSCIATFSKVVSKRFP